MSVSVDEHHWAAVSSHRLPSDSLIRPSFIRFIKDVVEAPLGTVSVAQVDKAETVLLLLKHTLQGPDSAQKQAAIEALSTEWVACVART